MLNFGKKIRVGVSVTPEVGLEVAQIDFATKQVLYYASKPLVYDGNRKDIADLDIFKETLNELFLEMELPKGAEIMLNIPTVTFNVSDYPASLDQEQVRAVIEDELINKPIFQNNDPSMSFVKLSNSTIQFSKYVYTAAQRATLVEIAMIIRNLGYNLVSIDTSVNSALNALIYNERVNVAPDSSWLLLMIENSSLRAITMQGACYVDCIEENLTIGEVLGDDENYSTVLDAVVPIIKNIPSQCLYVVSKTNIISAKVLANKLSYNAPIVHQEANCFATEPIMSAANENIPIKQMSLDVVGAAIYSEMANYSSAQLNLFNKDLGDVYLLYQPPIITVGSIKFQTSIENMIKLLIAFGLVVILILFAILLPLNSFIKQKEEVVSSLDSKIKEIEKFLNENKNVSASLFDEGDEIRIGLVNNKNVFSFYTIVGTEIPQKLWLTSLNLGKYITITGQADNLESVYSFFRNLKDYNNDANLKLQKLGLATNSGLSKINAENGFDTDSILTSMNADFYEFTISNAPEDAAKSDKDEKANNSKLEKNTNTKTKVKIPKLKPID